MNYTLVFHPEAEKELGESILWYSNQEKGLELEFIRCVDDAIQKIKRNPELFLIIFDNYIKKVVRRFPFIIIYEVSENLIFVLAAFHSRRNFERLRARL